MECLSPGDHLPEKQVIGLLVRESWVRIPPALIYSRWYTFQPVVLVHILARDDTILRCLL